MESRPTAQRVLEIISSVLGLDVDDLGTEIAMYRTPGWDSLAMLEIVTAIETEFGVQLDDDAVSACTSLAGILDIVDDE